MSLLEKLAKYDAIANTVNDQIEKIKASELESAKPQDFPLDGPQITNLDLFMAYTTAYLKGRKDLHQRRLKSNLQTSEPGPSGIAVEIYAFTKATDWVKHKTARDEITIHLLAAAPYFDLRIFQESTDVEFLITNREGI
jgi:miniconductance mechanosensitive channel